MEKKWWLKFFLVIGMAVTAIMFVYPTIVHLDVENSNYPVKSRMNLGLDLQGGLYMIYGVRIDKVLLKSIEGQALGVKDALAKKQIPITYEMLVNDKLDPHILVKFDAAHAGEVSDEVKKNFPSLITFKDDKTEMELGFSISHVTQIKESTLSQSIQVVTNRIDEFGVTEPNITSKGVDKLVVELPGVKDVERAKALLGQTAKLDFKMVDDQAMGKLNLPKMIDDIEKEHSLKFEEGKKFSEYVDQLNRFAHDKIPAGTEILFERTMDAQNKEIARAPFLLKSAAEVSGADLIDAQVQYGEYNDPVVGFQLNPVGAQKFAETTEKSIGKRMAIVLDGVIKSAPVINGKIPGGRGQITLGRSNPQETIKEAKNLTIVLRAGALPADLDLLEQRVIGPSLGQDSIHNGVKAGVIGCLMIFIFMSIYYRVSGIISVISLILNLTFSMAIMILLGATLTLPGIAGLALVIGMGVDSNVIILERIRDEIFEGANPTNAVQHGFARAFRAIFDANITHGIVGLILFNFGTGPLKGFAVTLLVGIVTTLFCAVTVSKLMFDYYIARKPKALSI